MSDEYTFPFDNEIEIYVREQLGETSEVRKTSIAEIRKYLEENEYLNARKDEYYILTFLRGCKFNIEKTKLKIRSYYEMRTSVPEWFSNRDPNLPEISKLIDLGCFVPIPQTTPGPLVVIIRTGVHDPWKHKQSDVFKTGMMILDVAVQQYESATIYGIYAIFDMKEVSFGHARQLPPSVVKTAVSTWQNYHCRPQLLEFVNAPIHINVVLNVFKSFMNSHLKDRVHIHYSDFDKLHKNISKDILPEEYGGTNGKLQDFIDFWSKKLVDSADWFKEDAKYKATLN